MNAILDRLDTVKTATIIEVAEWANEDTSDDAGLILENVLKVLEDRLNVREFVNLCSRLENGIKQFEIGTTYTCRSICDHNTIFEYTVIKRTAKQITIQDKWGKVSRRGVKANFENTAEMCYPVGHYSMCPMIDAAESAQA